MFLSKRLLRQITRGSPVINRRRVVGGVGLLVGSNLGSYMILYPAN